MKNQLIRSAYVRWIRPHFSDPMKLQRLKLLWFVWGYYPLLLLNATLGDRVSLIRRFMRIDWNLHHGHRPSEIAIICRAVAERPAASGEIMLEAGCFKGGSSAKFSIICRIFGYELHVYDSFQGVEPMSKEARMGTYDFSGEFAASEEEVRENIRRYGEIEVCSFFKGWFVDTVARGVSNPVKIAYIDCDTAKGTLEVLVGVLPALSKNGRVFSQDFHIKPVRDLLKDPLTWKNFGISPKLSTYGECLVQIGFPE